MMELVKTGRRAGDRGGDRTDPGLIARGLAVASEKHVAPGAGGSGLAKIERGDDIPPSDDREPASAEISGLRLDDGERQRDGDRRIDGISPCRRIANPTVDACGSADAIAPPEPTAYPLSAAVRAAAAAGAMAWQATRNARG